MNQDILRKKKQALEHQLKSINTSIYDHFHSKIKNYKTNILHITNSTLSPHNFHPNLFYILKNYIQKLININNTYITTIINSILTDENYSATKINIHNFVLSLYCIQILKDKIEENEKDPIVQNIECSESHINTMQIFIDIIHNTITFVNKDAILSCISFKACDNDLFNNIRELFIKPFKLNIDLLEMKFWCFKEMLDKQMQIFECYGFELQKIERLNSFKVTKDRGTFRLIEANHIINNDFLLYAEEKIDMFLDKINNNYVNDKIKGLIISYFFALNPGLIEFFKIEKYRKVSYYYFLKWLDNE